MKAPNFKAKDSQGREVSLSDFRGKWLVLYFYPKDFTPGCTAEACSLRDGYEEIRKLGAEILGVSMDSVESHRKFKQKYNLPFELITDEDGSIAKAFGAYGKKKVFGKEVEGILRKTFIIDPQGNIVHVIDKVDTKHHDRQVLEVLKKLIS